MCPGIFSCIDEVLWGATGYVTLWARKVTGAIQQCPGPRPELQAKGRQGPTHPHHRELAVGPYLPTS